jgi:hypothetical protein
MTSANPAIKNGSEVPRAASFRSPMRVLRDYLSSMPPIKLTACAFEQAARRFLVARLPRQARGGCKPSWVAYRQIFVSSASNIGAVRRRAQVTKRASMQHLECCGFYLGNAGVGYEDGQQEKRGRCKAEF